MAPVPGTLEYYHLPIQQRQQEYARQQWTIASEGGNPSDVPIQEYFSPSETAYFQSQYQAGLTGWQAEVKKKFPNQAAYLAEPEIAGILKQAVDNKWSPDILQSHLEASVWWHNHNPSQRQWFLLNATDPAGAQQSLQQQYQAYLNQSKTLGLGLNTSQIMQLAIQSLSMGWTQAQETEHMLDMASGHPTTGTTGVYRDQLKAMAGNYLMPASDSSLDAWTRSIAAGTASLDVYKDQMLRHAMNRYQDPGIRDALQRGMTVRDVLNPYLQQAAQTLGADPDTLNIGNLKWQEPLDYLDPSTGKRRAMTMSEWDQHVKMDPKYGYDASENGIASAASLVGQIREKFGVV